MADDQLSITFAALADPTRRAILARLATGEATVNELAEPFAITVQAISKHLKVLEHAGLITRGRDAQYRPCRFETEPSTVPWTGSTDTDRSGTNDSTCSREHLRTSTHTKTATATRRMIMNDTETTYGELTYTRI